MRSTIFIFLVLSVCSSVTLALSSEERDALSELWSVHSNTLSQLSPPWSSDVDQACGNGSNSAFYGVSCDTEGHLTSLDLRIPNGVPNLEGGLPASLGKLANLVYLNLRGNSFTGVIPESFGQMTQLQYLDMSNNHFSGPIPSSFGSLTKLSSLQLSWNNITGQIPDSLQNLTQLYSLLLNDNRLNGTIPSFSTLLGLYQISLSGNDLSGTIPPSLTSLPSLRILSLSNNHLNLCPVPTFSADVWGDAIGQNLVTHESCDCAVSYPRGVRATCKGPWLSASPDSIVSSPDSCPLPSPGDGFSCSGSTWIHDGTVIVPSIEVTGIVEVQSGSLEVSNDLTIRGMESSILTSEGCTSIGGKVVLSLSSSDVEHLISTASQERILLVSQNPACIQDLTELPVSLKTPSSKNSCYEITLDPKTSSNRYTLVASFVVRSSSWNCRTRWIVVGVSTGSVVVIVASVIVIAVFYWRARMAKGAGTPRVNTDA